MLLSMGRELMGVTMGDPTGVGGELALRSWRRGGDRFVVNDDPRRLERLSHHLDLGVKVIEVGKVSEGYDAFEEGVPVVRLGERVEVLPGDDEEDMRGVEMTRESIERVYGWAKGGEIVGMLTNPIDKGLLARRLEFSFPGHTEFLSFLEGREEGEAVMMLKGRGDSGVLRVVPVTLHVSLREALSLLEGERIKRVARTVASSLLGDCGGRVRMWFSGVNPHAGEGGLFGFEEEEVIRPAVCALRDEGYDCEGPYGADTMFTEWNRKLYDVALCMTHDQALIPVKSLYFSRTVNMTLGLDVKRVSPAHGVARGMAGKEGLDTGSWMYALGEGLKWGKGG